VPIREEEPRSCVTPLEPLAEEDLRKAPRGVAATADFLKKEKRRYQEREDH
jgi:hypothetical protein